MMKIKETKNKSKMNKFNYIELGRQKYLEELDVNHAKIVFNFRKRMAKFSDNFKGNGTVENCPLCGLHSRKNICKIQKKMSEKNSGVFT